MEFEYTNHYIEICTLFDSLFSMSKTVCGKMTKEIIDRLKIVINHTLLCWIKLCTEDYLLNQIIEYNGIEYFVQSCIEQARQFGMIDKRRAANVRYRVKVSIDHSKIENILLNGEVKSNIEKVVVHTRKTSNKRKLNDVTSN